MYIFSSLIIQLSSHHIISRSANNMRASSNRNQYSSGRKSGHSGSGRGQEGKSCSCIMIISWSLILGWLVFLFYAWQSGHLHATSRLPASYINRVNSVIDGIDQSLRGGVKVPQVSNKGNIGGGSTPEIPHTHVDAPATQIHTEKVAVTEQANNLPGADSEKSDIHVIFSTDCSTYQDWQTILLFHSAMTVGQKGPVTRIASGCDEAKQKELTQLYKKLFPQYHVHFTPDFKKDGKTGRSCKSLLTTFSLYYRASRGLLYIAPATLIFSLR